MLKQIALMAGLFASPALYAADNPLVGIWTFDATQSRLIEKDLRITRVGPDRLRSEGALGGTYEFGFDDAGTSLNGRIIRWTTIATNRWRVTRTKGGAPVDTIDVAVRGNVLVAATSGKLPDGSPYQRTVTYRRAGKGSDLAGLWRSVKVDTGATWDGFVISESADGVVTWRVPTDLQTITGKFDGSDLDIVGPNGPTGTTLAWRATAPRSFAYVMKSGGTIAERGTVTVSADGRRLTELSWEEGQPGRTSKLVYTR